MKRACTTIVALGIMIGAAGFVLLVEARPGQVTLTAIDDTYVNSVEGNVDSNYGAAYFLRVSKWQFSSTVYERLTWLKFDLSSVPDGVVVDVATLQLHTSTVVETYTVYAHSCSVSSWTELTLTYSNKPSFNPTSMSSTVILAGTPTKWYNWNVIDAVRNSLNNEANLVTIVLRETTIRGLLSFVSFDSKEEGNGAHAPKLIVHWIPVTDDSNPPTTLHDYDGLWHTADFTTTLTATDDLSGVAETYYKINDAPTQNVSAHGQPLITMENANNRLEYWSIDKAGNEELPHKILTGIKLDKTCPTIKTPSRTPDGETFPDQSVKVSVNVTDAVSEVNNVTLSYTTNDGATWTDLPMNYNSSINLYEATIPSQPSSTQVRYKIVSYDHAGNNATLDGTEPYCTYQVIPEFLQLLIMPLFIIATLLAVIVYRRKHFM